MRAEIKRDYSLLSTAVLSFKTTHQRIPAPPSQTLCHEWKKASVFENNPSETIIGRKIFWKINSGLKRTMEYCFLSDTKRGRLYVCLLRVRATFPSSPHPLCLFTTLGRARVCTTPIFSSLRRQSFFARIYLPVPERASRRAFSRGANFAAVCIRHCEGPGGNLCANLKGISRNETIPLIMHRCAK